jgi:hypothetical protein
MQDQYVLWFRGGLRLRLSVGRARRKIMGEENGEAQEIKEYFPSDSPTRR